MREYGPGAPRYKPPRSSASPVRRAFFGDETSFDSLWIGAESVSCHYWVPGFGMMWDVLPLRNRLKVLRCQPAADLAGGPRRHVQALSVNNRWRGYLTNYGQPINLVFRLQDPKPVVYMKGNLQVTVKPKGRKRHWDYQNVGGGKASVLALQILGEGIRWKLEETKVLVAMEKMCAMQQCGEVKLVGVGCGCPPGGAVGVRQGTQDAEGRGQCRVDVVASARLPLSWKEKQQQ
ncbi:hypothetical protein EJB05_02532, partial [Eragrostis curvula]